MKSPKPIWSLASCKRIKRFSPSWARTAVVICIKLYPFLSFLPFRDDQCPCWLPKCGKAGPASSTLKKTEITIWLRHWEHWGEWQRSWVPMGTRASNAPLLPAQLLFSSQNISGIHTKPSHYENVIHNILASTFHQLLSKILYKKEAFCCVYNACTTWWEAELKKCILFA